MLRGGRLNGAAVERRHTGDARAEAGGQRQGFGCDDGIVRLRAQAEGAAAAPDARCRRCGARKGEGGGDGGVFLRRPRRFGRRRRGVFVLSQRVHERQGQLPVVGGA